VGAVGDAERVLDAAGLEQRGELLVRVEQRVLRAAADPQQNQPIVYLLPVGDQRLEVEAARLR